MSLESGQIIDNKYRVVRIIGEGGMGAVFEGENVRIKRRVAIKTLHASIANNAEVVARFEREAQAAGRIGSDHILEVLDMGVLPTGDRYIVMEFLDGEPLSARMERLGRMSPGQLLPILRQVLEGLGAAHDAGIIHRDLKPDNLFILRQKAGVPDYVKIIDFGISKFTADSKSMSMTRTGTMLGTPLYMSPEQANGSADADPRSDLYAIGMIMYEAFNGSTPFTAQSFNELLFQIVLLQYPTLEQAIPGFDPELSRIVAKAATRERADRFQSAAEMWHALEDWKMRTGTVSERPPPAVGAAGMPAQNPSRFAGSQPGVSASQPGVAGSQPQFSGSQAGVHPLVAPAAPAAPATSTQGNWGSQSGVAELPRPKPSKAPVVIGIGLAAVLMLGGAAFTASRVLGGSAKQIDEKAEKPDEKKVDEKKPDEKEADEKKPDEKKVDEKKADEAADPAASAAPTASVIASASVAPKPIATAAPTVTATKIAAPKPTATATAATAAPTATTKKAQDWGY